MLTLGGCTIGAILVSLNPFKALPMFTPQKIHDYSHRGSSDLPPHIYLVADNAYRGILFDRKDQGVIVSGESGAGKTEATKQCLQFLAEVAGSASGVEQRILQANPILEAFGNAKTGRNNNSSRFGKFIRIHFDPKGGVGGAVMSTYLLEKSRVVFQGP